MSWCPSGAFARQRVVVKVCGLTKANRKAKKIIAVVLVALLVMGVAGWSLVKAKRIQINRFFIESNAVVGVDVSEHQADVDMGTLVDQDMQFVYVKATEGSSHVDARFAENWTHAHEAGLPVGAYHFFSFDSPGADQARGFIATVGELGEGDLIPVVDVEYYADKRDNPPDKAEVVRELRDFVDALEAEYGVKPMIYAGTDVYEAFIEGLVGDCPRWVPSVFYPVWFQVGDDWLVWQYTDKGRLEGLSGGEKYVDLNVVTDSMGFDRLLVGRR